MFEEFDTQQNGAQPQDVHAGSDQAGTPSQGFEVAEEIPMPHCPQAIGDENERVLHLVQ